MINTIALKRTWKSCKWLGVMVVGMAFSIPAFAQNAESTPPTNNNVKLGQKALLDGDFKTAANYLAKALPAEAADPNVHYMLGYSQYHSGDYKKALASFAKVVELRPDDAAAYYYRGKVNSTLAVQTGSKASLSNREAMLKEAISDYSKAISIDPSDAKLYMNRGIAYRDLGILRGTQGAANYSKSVASEAYDQAVEDFEKVLSITPGKKDVQTELKKAKVYKDGLK
jgi:tetratricopeptide (TPR) repeat protein